MTTPCALWLTASAIAQEPPTSFNDICFSTIADQAELQSPEPWKRWLKKVPHQKCSIQQINPRSGRGCRINGLARLVTDWTDDALLRLQLQPNQHFSLHLFHGDRGVTLLYDAELGGWIAYVTTRLPNAPRPNRLTLAATDHGRARRSEFGAPVPIGLHCTGDELVLTRGDLVLLGAPFPGLPQEIYLDGRVAFHAADMTHCVALPTTATQASSNPIRPATLGWKKRLAEGATFEVLDSGGVRLVAERSNASSWVTTPIPDHGPRELIVRLDHVAPGTGLFLSPGDDREPRSVIYFVRNRRDGRTCVVLAGNAQRHERDWNPFPTHSIPYVNDTVWVRLVFGAGTLRWWISIDGRHWAEAEQPMGPLQARCSHLGLYHVRGVEGCRIELGLIEVHALVNLASCSSPDQLARALAVIDQLSLDKEMPLWRESVAHACPPEFEAAAWNRACAVAALGAGCSAHLGADLLNQIMDEASQETWPVTKQLQLLDEVGLLADSRRLSAHGPPLSTRYFQVGHRAWRQEGLPPMSSIRRALMESSMDRHSNVTWTMDGIVREQILDLVYREQWSELRDQCRVLDFFGLLRYDRLVVWADQLSSSRLRARPIITGRRVPTLSWHRLLSEELNRDVYNHIVELDWLLKSRLWDEAARHIATTMTTAQRGVAPSPDDSSLLTSSPAAIRAALQHHGELVARLEADYGELFQLRAERAIQHRQTHAVARLANQFPGLNASRYAETWLADQLLARGRAEEALRYYQSAASNDAAEVDGDLRARLRIAAALAGQPLDITVDSDVHIGDLTLSPAELTQLADELLQRQSRDRQRAATENRSLYDSDVIRTGSRTPLPLAVGKDPGKEVLPGVNSLRVDWPGRQLAAVRTADQLLVHNRFELVALDWATGQSRWTSHPMRDETSRDKILRSRDWPLIPMRPLVHDQRVLARHLNAESPQLACWDVDSGKLFWTSPPDQQIPISDPFVIGEQLAVLTLDKQRSVDALLHLRIIDANTGQYSDSIPLLRVRDTWWQRSSCQVLANNQRLFAVLGGVSLCCDGTGNLRWIRSSRTIPPEADRTWITQVHQPPLMAHDTLVLAQVGVRAVEAVDPETGVLRWRTVMPHLQRVVGIAGKQVIVKSQNGFSSLDIETGRLRWQQTDTQLLLAAACTTEDGIVYTRSQSRQDDSQQRAVQIVQLDARTGTVRGSFTLEQLAGSQPNVGPLIVGDDRSWAFFSVGTLGGQREMVELLGE